MGILGDQNVFRCISGEVVLISIQAVTVLLQKRHVMDANRQRIIQSIVTRNAYTYNSIQSSQGNSTCPILKVSEQIYVGTNVQEITAGAGDCFWQHEQ